MSNEVKPHLKVRGARLDLVRRLLWGQYKEQHYKTKAAFAKYLGCNDTSTYRRWVDGKADMADYAVEKLGDHHGITSDYLKRGVTRGLPGWFYEKIVTAA